MMVDPTPMRNDDRRTVSKTCEATHLCLAGDGDKNDERRSVFKKPRSDKNGLYDERRAVIAVLYLVVRRLRHGCRESQA
jgi:hypothetical protein